MIKGKEYKVEAKPVKITVHKPKGEDLSARKEYLEMISLSWKDSSYWKDTNEYKSLRSEVPIFLLSTDISLPPRRIFDLE